MLPWLRSDKSKAAATSALVELEREVALLSGPQAVPGLLRLASAQAQAGLTTRAVTHYIRALDILIPDGRLRAALVVCEKILDLAPQMLRPRCTQTWLELGGPRPPHEIETVIAGYADAAYLAGHASLAAVQLAWMEGVVAEPALRIAIADGLFACDAPTSADRVLGLVYAELNGLRPPRRPRLDAWMGRMIEAVALNAAQVEEQGGRGGAPHAPQPDMPAPRRKTRKKKVAAGE